MRGGTITGIKLKKGLLISFIALVVLAAGGITLKYVLGSYDFNRILYNGRTYLKSSIQTMDEELSSNRYEVQSTGTYCKGMEVFVTQNNRIPVAIFLKTRYGKYVTYTLVGGP